MIGFLDRYYSLILVLALPAPLWFGEVVNLRTLGLTALHDGIVWSAILLAVWFLVRKIPRYHIRGVWRSPTKEESNLYFRLLLAVLIIDFGSKALFFRWDRPQQVEVFKNFGLHSVFHATPFESFHVFLMLYFFYMYMIGPLFFRYSNRILDRVWTASCASALGGTAALVTEKFLFEGVHNSFYFAGPLMWLCPPCASPRFISYAWTPADFFWHAAVMPIFLLTTSYFVPAPSPSGGASRAAPPSATLLQDGAP